MSGLPTQIPLQSVPLGQKGADGDLYLEFNWYLFLYNLSKQVFGNQSGGGSTPGSGNDLIDMLALNAATTDVPQAYRKIANLHAIQALGVIPDGTDIADLRKRITNLQMLVAAILLPDPPPKAGAVIAVTPGASPWTYTAIHDGTMVISGTVSPVIALARYGVNVPLGLVDGIIPMRESDQLTLTWSGGTPPTLNFLPNQ